MGVTLLVLAAVLIALSLADPLPGGSLDPLKIPKWVTTIPNPRVFLHPQALQFNLSQQLLQVLPSGFPKTVVWSFTDPAIPIVETESGRRVIVTWRNGLVDEKGDYLPHLFPIDTTLHFYGSPFIPKSTEPLLDTPVPMVIHLHGAVVPSNNDGHPDAWVMPNARNIPANMPRRGPTFHSLDPNIPGVIVSEYPNAQPATMLWFHPHTLGITRTNIYTLATGIWLIRDSIEHELRIPKKPFELPLVLQDRSFNTDGGFFYPPNVKWAGYDGPTWPNPGTPPPIWNPETFGNVWMVNGVVWPKIEVQQRRYRLRLLNACNDRYVLLSFRTNTERPLPFWVIGTDQGFRSEKALQVLELLVSPAERFDLIFDFGTLPVGTQIFLRNTGPDGPFQTLDNIDPVADPDTTGVILRFNVVPIQGQDHSIDPSLLKLPIIAPLTTTRPPLSIALNENLYEHNGDEQPITVELATAQHPKLHWNDSVPQELQMGQGQVHRWTFVDNSGDSHPMHIHLVRHQILGRNLIGNTTMIPPLPFELGWKDTVTCFPGYETHIIAEFGPYLATQQHPYVFHCHIASHEDNEMMLNFLVVRDVQK